MDRRKGVAYIRVSTDDQAMEGVSLDAQRARILLYADLHQIDVVAWFEDAGISGKTLSARPGAQSAIQRACEEKATLIVYSLSRLSRTLLDMLAIFETLNKSGADLASLTELFDTSTAAGRMIFKIFGVFAEFEREIIGERTKACLTHVARQGKRTSRHPPYGFRYGDNGNLVPDSAEEQRQRNWILVVQRDPELSCDDIASNLNDLGWKYRGGRNWHARDVERVLDYAKKRGEIQ